MSADDRFDSGSMGEHQLDAEGVGGRLVGVPDKMEHARLGVDIDREAVAVDQFKMEMALQERRLGLAPLLKQGPPALDRVGAVHRPLAAQLLGGEQVADCHGRSPFSL